jgi:hypothetical protein
MPLLSYSKSLDDSGFKGYDVYLRNQKVGFVLDLLMDDNGNFQYLLIQAGLWIMGQQLLLPFRLFELDHQSQCFRGQDFTRQQIRLFDSSRLLYLSQVS